MLDIFEFTTESSAVCLCCALLSLKLSDSLLITFTWVRFNNNIKKFDSRPTSMSLRGLVLRLTDNDSMSPSSEGVRFLEGVS